MEKWTGAWKRYYYLVEWLFFYWVIVKLQPFGIVPGDSLHELLYARNSYRNTTIAYQAV
jgi:hypothetical protein